MTALPRIRGPWLGSPGFLRSELSEFARQKDPEGNAQVKAGQRSCMTGLGQGQPQGDRWQLSDLTSA